MIRRMYVQKPSTLLRVYGSVRTNTLPDELRNLVDWTPGSMNPATVLRQFVAILTLLSPFAERGPACVGVFTRNLVRMVSRDGVQRKPVWMVLQAFGWGDLAKASKPPEAWTGRPPTYGEIRFMTFDGIINGAGGVIYWGAPYLTKNDGTWESLKSVAAELHEIRPILTGDVRAADQIVKPSNPAIEVAVRAIGSRPFLLLANTAGTPERTTLLFHGIKVKALKPVGKTAVKGPQASTAQLSLKPLEVVLLALEE
jgi:hypothetical protein